MSTDRLGPIARGAGLQVFAPAGAATLVNINPEACSREYRFLLAAFQSIRPQVVISLGAAADTPRHALLLSLMDRAGLGDGSVVPVPMPAAGQPDTVGTTILEQLLAQGVVVDAILFPDTYPLSAIAPWFAAAPHLLSERGLLAGGHDVEADLDFARAPTPQARMDVTYAQGYWHASRHRFVVPTMPMQFIPRLEPIFPIFLEDELPQVTREQFIPFTQAGVECLHHQFGGERFISRFPPNLPESETDQFVFSPPYMAEGPTEGRFMAFLRGAKVSGMLPLVYTRHNQLCMESFLPARHSAPIVLPELHKGEMTILQGTLAAQRPHGPVREREQLCATFAREIRIDEPAVIVPYGVLNCYHHFLFGLLPHFWYLDEYPELRHLPIVLPQITARFHKQFLNLLGIDSDDARRVIFIDHSVTLRVEKGYFPSLPDRPFQAPRFMKWLRDTFLPKAAKLPQGYEGGRYYISRRDTPRRQIANEDAIIDMITPLGFQVLEWSAFSVPEQIALAHHAEMVICPHGSSFSNLVFMKPGCRVLEIFPTCSELWGALDNMTFMVQNLGGKHFGIMGRGTDPNVHPTMQAVSLPLDEFRTALDLMLAG